VGEGSRFVHEEVADPVRELKEYYRSVWTVGKMLQASGLLADLRFGEDDLEVLLRYVDCGIGPEHARGIHLEMRRFAREMLRLCGTLSAAKLIGLLESHHASGARSVQRHAKSQLEM
jgi:hypothetical protein